MKEIYPITFDFQLAKEKGLIENNKLGEKYFNLQKIYKINFEKYINDILNLKMYDEMISNSELKFGTCPKERKDYYQETSTLDLKYIYIKNNLHIENLNIEDIELLKSNDDSKILDMIKRTYPTVIMFNTINNKKYEDKFQTQFFKEFSTKETLFYNDELIIIIKEGNAYNNLIDEEFKINLKKKYDFINDMINKMNIEFKNKLDCPVTICHLLR